MFILWQIKIYSVGLTTPCANNVARSLPFKNTLNRVILIKTAFYCLVGLIFAHAVTLSANTP